MATAKAKFSIKLVKLVDDDDKKDNSKIMSHDELEASIKRLNELSLSTSRKHHETID